MAIHDCNSQRLYVDHDLRAGAVVQATDDQFNYLVRVMRLGTRRPAGYLHEVHREHTAIVDALEAQRPGPALKALYDHLRHTDY